MSLSFVLSTDFLFILLLFLSKSKVNVVTRHKKLKKKHANNAACKPPNTACNTITSSYHWQTSTAIAAALYQKKILSLINNFVKHFYRQLTPTGLIIIIQ